MAQVVEHLPSKYKALSSNTCRERERERERGRKEGRKEERKEKKAGGMAQMVQHLT
jgi:hypothetical protein